MMIYVFDRVENTGQKEKMLVTSIFPSSTMFLKGFLPRGSCPTRMAQWRACRTPDLVVVSLPLASAEACEKSSWWLWKEICVCTVVRKPGNMIVCITDRHDMTLAVKVALILIQPNNLRVIKGGYCGLNPFLNNKF